MSGTENYKNVYDDDFFAYTSGISWKSAQKVVPVFRELLPFCKSVADFGCAEGVWLKCWLLNGVEDVVGVDGDYVNTEALHISKEAFFARNLDEAVDLGRRFDVACSLEVAEHLSPESSRQFVQSLTRHSDVVIFSAAPPGQGGEFHMNEREYDEWRSFFRDEGYEAYDCIRPKLKGFHDVSFWYRYNIVLYVKQTVANKLPEAIKATKVDANAKIPDIAPPIFKLRKSIVKLLPYGVQNRLAALNSKLRSIAG
ncbi:MAG: hypothetical protein CMO07_11225 [Thalassospira sp.]|uniref:class I SAM-dependent methyltransferase n=1 Tax=unclassified Thalassospira TaxID=2648997 RepID=UPI000C54ECCC|nr:MULTISPECIES: class I SAM-dependent methyltransferase [unclassified Thalassospira]MBE71272.1 hypothetical protein [Thalassospira sp.]QPO11635.1 class I SAM-dependent methyltransferase [Thalassospira sp. A40-3]|tara:strand:- start:1520 stop:2281 length:762 start_codon:yes stop_codon:yes gene_type:complete